MTCKVNWIGLNYDQADRRRTEWLKGSFMVDLAKEHAGKAWFIEQMETVVRPLSVAMMQQSVSGHGAVSGELVSKFLEMIRFSDACCDVMENVMNIMYYEVHWRGWHIVPGIVPWFSQGSEEWKNVPYKYKRHFKWPAK